MILSLLCSVVAYDLGPRTPLPWINQPEWQWMILDAINRRRALHDSPPLQWSVRAANDAYRHALDPRSVHDPSTFEFADILARGSLRDPLFYIWQFYDEEEVKIHYDNYYQEDNGPVGHAMHIIWRAYQFVGCAMVQYNPPINRFNVPFFMTCMLGPKHGELLDGYFPANVVPHKTTWPRGWKPPEKKSFHPMNRSYGPPWPGYVYRLRPTPSYTGQGASNIVYLIKQKFGTAYWDESRCIRYDQAVRSGGGYVPIWDESQIVPRGPVTMDQIVARAYGQSWAQILRPSYYPQSYQQPQAQAYQPQAHHPQTQAQAYPQAQAYQPQRYSNAWGQSSSRFPQTENYIRQSGGQTARPTTPRATQSYSQPQSRYADTWHDSGSRFPQTEALLRSGQISRQQASSHQSSIEELPGELSSVEQHGQSWQERFAADFGEPDSIDWQQELIYSFNDEDSPENVQWHEKYVGDFVPDDQTCKDFVFSEDTSRDYELALQLQSSLDL